MRWWIVALLLMFAATPAAADEISLTVSTDATTVAVGHPVLVTVTGPAAHRVTVEVNGAPWRELGTDAAGAASGEFVPAAVGTVTFVARTQATVASAVVDVAPAETTVGVSTRRIVRSESPVTVSAALALRSGVPWASGVTFEYKAWKQPWRPLASASTASDGRSHAQDRPWKATSYRVRFPGDRAAMAAVSQIARVATAPAHRPVRRPHRFPEPKHRNPDRPAPLGRGANARVTPIPDPVFRQMRGVSWQPGCLPRSSLRLVEVNYWGFDGYRYRGQLVVHVSVASRIARAFSSMHHIRYPFRQMRLVDDFGRSRWKGANDYRSMAADNTSAFNCRYVVGREPHVLSPHASGRSIDINPWENPYISPRGVYPNRAYLNRSVRHPAVINANSRVRRIMARAGCSWLGYSDTQHFDCWGSPRRAAVAADLGYPESWRHQPGDRYGWGLD